MNNQNSIPQDNSSSYSSSSRGSYGSDSNEPVGFAAHRGQSSEQRQEETTTQKGGGATGYDKDQERQEVKHEQDEMYRERREEDVNVERQQPAREGQQLNESGNGAQGTQSIH